MYIVITPLMQTTLYAQLKEEAIDFSYLKQEYGPFLELVDVLIGVVPNCDTVMEIWPTSFKTYNLLVPNLLNAPSSLFGRKSVKKMMGFAMYHSSYASGCNYCTAHTCSFALRRGVDESVIKGNLSKKESAVANFSKKMGAVPCAITSEDLIELKNYCDREEIEAISMGIVLMGFLNKYMDVTGIELEEKAINNVSDVLKNTKWSVGKHSPKNHKSVAIKKEHIQKDNLLTYLKIIKQIPGATSLEKQWLKDIPKSRFEINQFLKKRIGYHFPFLEKINSIQIKRAFTAVLTDNFSKKNTIIGLQIKTLCALVFYAKIKNYYLKMEIVTWAESNNIKISENFKEMITSLFIKSSKETSSLNEEEVELSTSSLKEKIAVYFTEKASNSPSQIDKKTIANLTGQFSLSEIIELVNWLSILQALHRLEKLPV